MSDTLAHGLIYIPAPGILNVATTVQLLFGTITKINSTH